MISNADVQSIAEHRLQTPQCPVFVAYDPNHSFSLGRYVCLECHEEVYHIVRNAFTHKGDTCEKTNGFIGSKIVYVMGDNEDATRHVEGSPFKGQDMKQLLEIAKRYFFDPTKK